MATTGTKKTTTGKMDGMVTIKNGAPLPGQEQVTIPPDGRVEFTAGDPGPYLLQFVEESSGKYAAVCLYLDPSGPVVVQAGPGEKSKNCPYNVYTTNANKKGSTLTSAGKAAGGGNRIIITS
jgi:hypothetical protein